MKQTEFDIKKLARRALELCREDRAAFAEMSEAQRDRYAATFFLAASVLRKETHIEADSH